MTPQIRPASAADKTALVEILADGFHDDPVMGWAFNSFSAIPSFLKAMADLNFKAGGVAHIEAQGKGASLWLKPGQSYDQGFGFTLRMLGINARHGGLTGARRGMAMGAFMAKHHPHEPHYYLFAIAARASAQGQGIGGAVMRAGLALADAEGMPCYLENSKERNLGFYRAHGFEVLKEVETPDDCPPMWPMWRPANPSR